VKQYTAAGGGRLGPPRSALRTEPTVPLYPDALVSYLQGLLQPVELPQGERSFVRYR
jgi:hypothetical protein